MKQNKSKIKHLLISVIFAFLQRFKGVSANLVHSILKEKKIAVIFRILQLDYRHWLN